MKHIASIAVVTLLAFGTGCAETVAHPSMVASSNGESVVDVHELPPDSPGMMPIVQDTGAWNHYDVDHPTKRRGLSGGAIAGIVLGTAGGAALLGLLFVAASGFGKSSGGGVSFGHCCNWAGD